MAFKMKGFIPKGDKPIKKNWWDKWGKKFAKKLGWQDKHINPPK